MLNTSLAGVGKFCIALNLYYYTSEDTLHCIKEEFH